MLFQVRIQNLGKLADATVRVGGLTVLAGVNNTGKTFFSKSLYSVFDAMHGNHVMGHVDRESLPLRRDLSLLTNENMDGPLFSAPLPPVGELIAAAERMRAIAKTCSIESERSGLVAPNQEYSALREAAEAVSAAYSQLAPELDKWASSVPPTARVFHITEHGPKQINAQQLHESIKENAERLRDAAQNTAFGFVRAGFQHKVSLNFVQNFQVQKISDLKANSGQAAIQINGSPFLTIENGNVAAPSGFPMSTLLELQLRSRVIYLESPALWKMKDALETARYLSGAAFAYKKLNGVPGYFYDLANAMRAKSPGDVDFPDVLRHLNANVIRGKIAIDESDDLVFHESEGGKYPLSTTATGIANLGVLALLIERKILDKGTFLFIDEPESNLHPAWQVEMLRALLDLARGGVNVVIATHSADIMERLRALVSKYPELEELIALNHFSPEGVNVRGEKSFRQRAGDILEELTEEFAESYMGKVGLEEEAK